MYNFNALTCCVDQEAYDPYNSDAGDGLFPDGSWVAPPPQSNVYTPWNTAMAAAMLTAMPIKPDIVTGELFDHVYFAQESAVLLIS